MLMWRSITLTGCSNLFKVNVKVIEPKVITEKLQSDEFLGKVAKAIQGEVQTRILEQQYDEIADPTAGDRLKAMAAGLSYRVEDGEIIFETIEGAAAVEKAEDKTLRERLVEKLGREGREALPQLQALEKFERESGNKLTTRAAIRAALRRLSFKHKATVEKQKKELVKAAREGGSIFKNRPSPTI